MKFVKKIIFSSMTAWFFPCIQKHEINYSCMHPASHECCYNVIRECSCGLSWSLNSKLLYWSWPFTWTKNVCNNVSNCAKQTGGEKKNPMSLDRKQIKYWNDMKKKKEDNRPSHWWLDISNPFFQNVEQTLCFELCLRQRLKEGTVTGLLSQHRPSFHQWKIYGERPGRSK